MAAEAIDLDRYVEILELFPADLPQAVTITYALSHLWPDEDFTSFGNICQTSRSNSNFGDQLVSSCGWISSPWIMKSIR